MHPQQTVSHITPQLSQIAVPSGVQSYCRLSKGDRPIIILHGRMENGLCWLPVAREIKGDFEIVMPDFRGHGKSRMIEEGVTIATLVEDLTLFIRKLHIDLPILLGHSMGAAVAAEYCAENPDTVSALILSDPPWFFDTEYRDGDIQIVEKMRKTIRRNKEARLETLQSYIHFSNPRWSREQCGYVALAWQEVSERVAESYQSPVSFSQWLDKFTPGKVPLMLIYGNPDKGAIVTEKVVKRVMDLDPSVHHVYVQGAGHNIHRDELNTFCSHVNTFFEKSINGASMQSC